MSSRLVVKCVCPLSWKAFLTLFGRSGNFQTNQLRLERITPNSTVPTLWGKWVYIDQTAWIKGIVCFFQICFSSLSLLWQTVSDCWWCYACPCFVWANTPLVETCFLPHSLKWNLQHRMKSSLSLPNDCVDFPFLLFQPHKKITAAQKSLAKVDKTGMKPMSSFFSPKVKAERKWVLCSFYFSNKVKKI